MSAVLRADCPSCGTVEVPFANIRLVFDAQSSTEPGTVEFACPRCQQHASQRVGDRAVRLLSGAGVRLVAAPPVPKVAPAVDDADRSG